MSETDRPRPRGHVEPTPEARPLPPAWRDHFQGPIPGLPPRPTPAAGQAPPNQGTASQAGTPSQEGPSAPPPAPSPAPQTAASSGQSGPVRPAAAPPEPHPAHQPEVDRRIPLSGDGRERADEERQGKSGRDAAALLKPLAAGAALLAVAGVRLAARGVSRLADALANRRRPS